MNVITIRDLMACASQTLAYNDGVPPPVPHYTITQNEMMCDEGMVPLYSLPDPVLPTSMQTETSLLTFEYKNTTPLCLKPPTMECRKRRREEDESDITPPTTAPRRNEEWLSWINWDRVE